MKSMYREETMPGSECISSGLCNEKRGACARGHDVVQVEQPTLSRNCKVCVPSRIKLLLKTSTRAYFFTY